MFIVNFFGWFLLVGVPFYGFRAGGSAMFSLAVLAMFSGLAVRLLTPWLYELVAGRTVYIGIGQSVLFLLLLALAFPLSIRLSRFVPLNFDPFDWLLGFVFGLIAGGISAHFMLSFLLMAYHETTLYPQLQQLFIVKQLVHFDAWYQLTNTMDRLGSFLSPATAAHE